ncbi:HipA domain-containing protein [Caballeronia cordobensis]|uniref:HipA domain-containing protein n=1 Tax=Caballeronia cordobensis TaxID=1353886 RepID=UPI00045EF33D|nr:Hipa protein [Burkholderia sp. RPE67]
MADQGIAAANKVWSLSPAYDITFAHNPKGEWTHQHLMSINGKFKDFTVRDLLAEANRFGIGTAGRVIDQVRAAIGDWTHFADEAELPNDEMTTIQKQHLLLL